MASSRDKTIMRSLGEFFGHIVQGIRTDPARREMRRETEEVEHGNVVLRRTTIEEIEFKRSAGSGESPIPPSPPSSPTST